MPLSRGTFLVLCLFSLNAFAISSEEKLIDGLVQEKWDWVVSESHEWLKADGLAVIPKVRGASALIHLGLFHSANFYLKRISPADWRRGVSPSLAKSFFDTYTILSQHLPWNELVELPESLKTKPPLTGTAFFALGYDAFHRQKWDLATEWLLKVKEPVALAEDAAQLSAAILVKRHLYPKALAALERYQSESSRRMKARIYFAMKDYAQALALYDELPGPRTERAWSAVGAKQNQKALAALGDTTGDDPEGIEADLLRATLAVTLKRRDLARTSAQRAEKALRDRMAGEAATTTAPAELDREREGLNSRKEAPAFRYLAEQLEQVTGRMKDARDRQRQLATANQRATAERRWVKARLLLSQSLLPESKTAAEYAGALNEALRWVEEASEITRGNYPELEMRRAELIWKIAALQTGAEAQAKYEQALRGVDRVYRSFPQYADRAHAVFFLANANIKTGKETEAKSLLEEFLKTYPKDRRIPDAYRLVGDIDFDAARYEAAEKNYLKVLETPRSPFVGYAYYKLGWSNYHQRKFPRALSFLEEAIAWSDRWEKSEAVTQLEKEARRDLISVYAETGDTRKAPIYFEKFLRGESKSWIVELAEKLEAQGQYEKAGALYRYVIRKDPNSNDNLIYLTAIIRGAARVRDWETALKTAKEMTATFGPTLLNPPTEDNKEKSTPELVEEDFRGAVLAFHQEQKSANNATLDPALQELTLVYLKAFRAWKQNEPAILRYAQWLSRKSATKEAVVFFREYWKRFGATVEPTRREEGLRGYIEALDALEPKSKTLRIASLPADADYREMVEKVNEYLQLFPTAAQARAVAYLGAVSQLAHGDLEKGMTACQKLFDFHPLDEQGKLCFNNLRVARYETKNWGDIYQWATEIDGRKFPGIEAYHRDLLVIRNESLMKWAENEKDDEAAAKIYRSAVEHRELQAIWEKALYNAFVRWNRAGNNLAALETATRLEAEFPKSVFLPEVSANRAAIYQEAGDYQRAYPQLVFYLRKGNPTEKASHFAQAQLNAGALAAALQKGEEANYWLALYDKNPQATLGGKALARTVLKAAANGGRQIASIAPNQWESLISDKAGFETSPIPSQGGLQSRIKEAATRLEKMSRQFLDLSAHQTYEGNESLCALATTYSIFERSLRDLALTAGDNSPQVLKLAVPLTAKSKEFADDCLKRAAEAEHDGPFFRQVNARWGWEWDSILGQRISQLVRDLAPYYPSFDPLTVQRDEEGILQMHLQKVSSAESWYTLTRLRCQKGASAHCRLTLTDALTKFPTSGKLLNSTAILFGKESRELPSSLFARASEQGSIYALPNLAYYHLKEGRIGPGLNILRRAYGEEAYDFNPEFKETLEPWVKR